MADALKAFAISTVATAPSPAASGTSLVVAAGHGARFPATPFNATVCPAAATPDPTNAEIVRVTNISTDTLTIEREQEGTSARTIGTGDLIFQGVTPKMIEDPRAPANHDHASNKLAQSNTHASPDTDTAPTALHHTLGTGANQAAAGNHNHSGVYEPVQTAASQAEMEAGTETAIRSMTPQRVRQAIAALAGLNNVCEFEAAELKPPASNFFNWDTRGDPGLIATFQDTTADQIAILVKRARKGVPLSSGVVVDLDWMSESATSGAVKWEIAFARLNPGNQDADSISWDTVTTVVSNCDTSAAGKLSKASITVAYADMDGIEPGDLFAMRIVRRQSDTTNDTMTSKAHLLGGEIRSAA